MGMSCSSGWAAQYSSEGGRSHDYHMINATGLYLAGHDWAAQYSSEGGRSHDYHMINVTGLYLVGHDWAGQCSSEGLQLASRGSHDCHMTYVRSLRCTHLPRIRRSS